MYGTWCASRCAHRKTNSRAIGSLNSASAVRQDILRAQQKNICDPNHLICMEPSAARLSKAPAAFVTLSTPKITRAWFDPGSSPQ